MNKKWSSDKVKDVQRWLIKRWPESFTRGPDLRPLSLEIHKDILAHREENTQLSSRVVREVLKRHTTSYGYLYGMTKHDKRYDLKGEAVGEIAQSHRDWARSALRLKQKEAQRIRKEQRQKIKDQRTRDRKTREKLNAQSRMGATDGAPDAVDSKGPVIKYKPARRRIIKPSAEHPVDLVG